MAEKIQSLELEGAIRDGRLQVAMAIATVSTKVTVDAHPTADAPFTTVPDDLFDRTFSDPRVGLGDADMPAFKQLLAVSLPSIAAKVRSDIPDEADLEIHQVAKLVQLALAMQ